MADSLGSMRRGRCTRARVRLIAATSAAASAGGGLGHPEAAGT